MGLGCSGGAGEAICGGPDEGGGSTAWTGPSGGVAAGTTCVGPFGTGPIGTTDGGTITTTGGFRQSCPCSSNPGGQTHSLPFLMKGRSQDAVSGSCSGFTQSLPLRTMG